MYLRRYIANVISPAHRTLEASANPNPTVTILQLHESLPPEPSRAGTVERRPAAGAGGSEP